MTGSDKKQNNHKQPKQEKKEKENKEESEELHDSDYEDKYPDDLPSDKELLQMVKGDATTFGLSSTLVVLLIAAALYLWAKYYS